MNKFEAEKALQQMQCFLGSKPLNEIKKGIVNKNLRAERLNDLLVALETFMPEVQARRTFPNFESPTTSNLLYAHDSIAQALFFLDLLFDTISNQEGQTISDDNIYANLVLSALDAAVGTLEPLKQPLSEETQPFVTNLPIEPIYV